MRPFGAFIDWSDCDHYGVATFRTVGTAASPQNIATIENPAASARRVVVAYIGVSMDTTAVLATVAPSINLSRPTALPTGGTTLTATKEDTRSVNPSAIVRGGTASDGGAASAITATAGASWRTYQEERLHTAAGIAPANLIALLGLAICERDYALLLAGEALLVQGVTASAATTDFIVTILWGEFTP